MSCVVDEACARGHICQGFACTPGCNDDDRCSPIDVCMDGSCLSGCLSPDGCRMGFVCDEEQEVCVPEPPGTCAAPVEIADGVYFGSNLEGESALRGSCTGQDAPEAVFSYVAAQDGPVCADTFGSEFDTVLHVRAEPCNGEEPIELACNDDDSGGLQSAVRFDAEQGGRYFVIVDSFSTPGSFRLRIGPCDD